MFPLTDDSVMKHTKQETDTHLILAIIDSSSSDDESESDESDVFSVSCHGNHFKQLKEKPKQYDEFAIKRRKLHTQLNLLNSDLMSMMTFGGSETSPEQPSPISSVPCKRPRKMPRSKERKRLAGKVDAVSKSTSATRYSE